MVEKCLYACLGGSEAIQTVVVMLYDKILSDKKLKPFFSTVDLMHLKRSQVAFLSMAFGGPHHYTGEDLRKVHMRFVKDGSLKDEHFDAVANHLLTSLHELKIDQALIDQVMDIVESTRNDVLCKDIG